MTTKPEHIEPGVFQVQGVLAGSHEGDVLDVDNHVHPPQRLEAVPGASIERIEVIAGQAATRIVHSIRKAS